MKIYGSRAEVFHGTAIQTTGKLKKENLIKVNGHIKSKKKHTQMKVAKNNPLTNFLQPKKSGKFGAINTELSKKPPKTMLNNFRDMIAPKKSKKKKNTIVGNFMNLFA